MLSNTECCQNLQIKTGVSTYTVGWPKSRTLETRVSSETPIADEDVKQPELPFSAGGMQIASGRYYSSSQS